MEHVEHVDGSTPVQMFDENDANLLRSDCLPINHSREPVTAHSLSKEVLGLSQSDQAIYSLRPSTLSSRTAIREKFSVNVASKSRTRE